ncbi:nucleotidyltransferase domain-containing protein [Nocardia spumae]|uniref:nucleotidyltransferase domain-containing protein n=1 Tax=Nocardia spumae TaxID=2887190 RepID=UPI001D14F307|nr:nucleotidyltransferase domain-containing protein [Nocardia spumae]
MAASLVGPRSLPAQLRPYLRELVRRTRIVCEPQLVSIFAVGSLALGDYRHGRSDVDITVVADPALPDAALLELAEALTDLDCPAAGLELVLYDADVIGQRCDRAGYRLDLNTGPLLPHRVSVDAAQSPAFWYVIDRGVAYQAGRLLYGRPVRQVVGAPARADQLAAVSASVREHATGEGHLADNQVLNGCRSVMFCRTGRWFAKYAAAQDIRLTAARFRPLVDLALASFDRPRSSPDELPAAEVRRFLSWVAVEVESTVRSEPPPSSGAG